MAELIFVPFQARRIVLSSLARRRLRNPAAMVLLALSHETTQTLDDDTLARIVGIPGDELIAVIARLVTGGWFRASRGLTGTTYTLREDGPLKSAWIKPSHLDPADRC